MEKEKLREAKGRERGKGIKRQNRRTETVVYRESQKEKSN